MVGGSGLRPRLPVPGKSRLKTAPTIYNSTANQCKFFNDVTRRFSGQRLGLTPDTRHLKPYRFVIIQPLLPIKPVNPTRHLLVPDLFNHDPGSHAVTGSILVADIRINIQFGPVAVKAVHQLFIALQHKFAPHFAGAG